MISYIEYSVLGALESLQSKESSLLGLVTAGTRKPPMELGKGLLVRQSSVFFCSEYVSKMGTTETACISPELQEISVCGGKSQRLGVTSRGDKGQIGSL